MCGCKKFGDIELDDARAEARSEYAEIIKDNPGNYAISHERAVLEDFIVTYYNAEEVYNYD